MNGSFAFEKVRADGDACGVSDALRRLVVRADRDRLARDVQPGQIDHDRMGESRDPHPAARVGDHRESWEFLGARRRFDGQCGNKRGA